jgi:hypothetical protein
MPAKPFPATFETRFKSAAIYSPAFASGSPSPAGINPNFSIL